MADADDSRDDPTDDRESASRGAALLRRRRGRQLLRLGATALILAAAAAAATVVWRFYVTAPWTRDGRVRAQVANIAPQVSGQILEIRIADNQTVKAGDVLYVIDTADFRIAVKAAEAEVANRQADLQVKSAEAKRRAELSDLAASAEEKQQYAGQAQIAAAALKAAQAQLDQAKTNLDRTTVRSTVNGKVTNLLMRVGDYARTGSPNISVIDTDSFWVDGYFEETKMAQIGVGDRAEVALLGYGSPLRGRVESITLGIATANAAPSTQGLPNVDPVYTWVRLAQRVPVRIRLEAVPAGVTLVAGMTATVVLGNGASPAAGWLRGLGWADRSPERAKP